MLSPEGPALLETSAGAMHGGGGGGESASTRAPQAPGPPVFQPLARYPAHQPQRGPCLACSAAIYRHSGIIIISPKATECFAPCNSARLAQAETVRGTLAIARRSPILEGVGRFLNTAAGPGATCLILLLRWRMNYCFSIETGFGAVIRLVPWQWRQQKEKRNP